MRCIACGDHERHAAQNFRCAQCGDLLEIIYPAWKRHRRQTPHATESVGASAAFLELRWTRAAFGVSANCYQHYERPASRSLCARATLLSTKCRGAPASPGVPRLYAKHQGMNPTGSFKDTGMTVAATFARRAGFRWVACASTGNTSASMAAYAARGGMRSLVLVPEGKFPGANFLRRSTTAP